MKRSFNWLAAALLTVGLLLTSTASASESGAAGTTIGPHDAYRTIGLGVAAAFAVAISIVGAGYAVGKIGSAALGAAVEKPELLIRSLLFVALAEGLAVLGFAISMMLIQKM